FVEIDSEQRRRAEHGQTILHDMPAGYGETVWHACAQNLRLHLARFWRRQAGEQPRLRRFVFAKADDAVYAGSARRLGKTLEMYIVAIEHRRAVRLDTQDNVR